MLKHCLQCSKQFSTKDSRQKTCGWTCAVHLRNRTKDTTWSQKPVVKPMTFLDLPDPETLPATYVKTVHDLWERLTTDSGSQKRIA